MKKLSFLLLGLMAVMVAWGSNATADSKADEETIVKLVNEIFEFRYFAQNDRNLPSVDEAFGTKEWQETIKKVEAIDRNSEGGGFFDFGDNGPLDPWVYDCFQGQAKADHIKVKQLSDDTAEVKFRIKDDANSKGTPLRWLMRKENGFWKVGNIFFVKNDDMDLLKAMQEYTSTHQVAPKQEARLIYCSCAETQHGVPGASKIFYELIADEGTTPKVTECGKNEYPVTEKEVTELQQKLQELGVHDLNGYNQDDQLCGGSSYRIYMEYADGTKINATWATKQPLPLADKAYYAINSYLYNLVKSNKK